jgi:hypothetical protein
MQKEQDVTYGISEKGSSLTITLSAKTREELYRDAVRAALEAVYGGAPPAGDSDGSTYPVQGAGLDEAEMLRTLFAECFVAAARAGGTLHPPRWIAFDEGRVTANLGLSKPKAPVRALAPALHGAIETSGAFPDFRATLGFSVPSH